MDLFSQLGGIYTSLNRVQDRQAARELSREVGDIRATLERGKYDEQALASRLETVRNRLRELLR